jgi:hypothetical protein
MALGERLLTSRTLAIMKPMSSFDPVLRDAQEPGTPVGRLVELSTRRSVRIRSAAAANPSIPDDLVLTLARDTNAAVRMAAADNSRGRPFVVRVLASSPYPAVRSAIAALNASGPGSVDRELQEQLADDTDPECRRSIARATNYLAVFEQLLRDPDPKVRGECAANPRATREHIETLVTDRSKVTRRMAVWSGVLYPDDEQLVRLARDRSADVRWGVISRVGAPREALEIIAAEPDETNSSHARRALNGDGVNSEIVVAETLRARIDATGLPPFES